MQLSPFEPPCSCCTIRRRTWTNALADRSHPAWTRMKFDELLAQQLSLKRAQRAPRQRRRRCPSSAPVREPLAPPCRSS
jgi:ATP-dependent DNA helicase RecG